MRVFLSNVQRFLLHHHTNPSQHPNGINPIDHAPPSRRCPVIDFTRRFARQVLRRRGRSGDDRRAKVGVHDGSCGIEGPILFAEGRRTAVG
jgi:hypothetical protein